jgi:hypothetical protein
MAIPIAEQVLGVVKEGLSAWKVFISTRQEAYNRKMDKRKEAALQIAEEWFEEAELLFAYMKTLNLTDPQKKEVNKMQAKYLDTKKRFNKYD